MEWQELDSVTKWKLDIRAVSSNGGRERVVVHGDDDDLALTRWAPASDGWTVEEIASAPTFGELTRSNQSLFTLRSGWEYEISGGAGVPPADVLRHLVIEPGWEPADDPAGDDDWSFVHETAMGVLGWPDNVEAVRAHVDGMAVMALHAGDGSVWLPILVDVTYDEPVLGQPLAESRFYSEGLGPVSWTGGRELWLAGDSWAVHRATGDIGPELEVLEISADRGIERLLADWIITHELEAEAALVLERPSGLEDGSAAQLAELCSDVAKLSHLSLSGSMNDEAVREHLSSESRLYTAVRAGLHEPASGVGQRLHDVLREAIHQGAFGVVKGLIHDG